jgi:hypothetical protein
MKELRLAWEPMNLTPLEDIEARFAGYVKGKKGVTLLGNGALLFITESDDAEADAKHAMQEAKFLTDFKAVRLKEGGYLVAFHEAVAVFVGDEEFASVKDEVRARRADLQFPGEVFLGGSGMSGDDLLVGLYARGKLQRDVHHFAFRKRING